MIAVENWTNHSNHNQTSPKNSGTLFSFHFTEFVLLRYYLLLTSVWEVVEWILKQNYFFLLFFHFD